MVGFGVLRGIVKQGVCFRSWHIKGVAPLSHEAENLFTAFRSQTHPESSRLGLSQVNPVSFHSPNTCRYGKLKRLELDVTFVLYETCMMCDRFLSWI